MHDSQGPQDSKQEDDWIAAADALDRLEGPLGGRAAAKATLAEMMRDGKLQCRADYMFLSGRKSIEECWELGADEKGFEIGRDVDVYREDWLESVQWAVDLDIWKWPESQFVITTQLRSLIRTYFDGVRFVNSEIERISFRDKLPNVGSIRMRVGRTPDVLRWTAFWLEVVKLSQLGRLNLTNFPSQAELSREIRDNMGKDPFSEEAVEPRVKQIWSLFIRG